MVVQLSSACRVPALSSKACVYLSGVCVTLFTKRSTVARVWNAEFRFDSWLNQWNGSEPSPPSKCAFNLWYKMHTMGLCVREVFLFWQVVRRPPSFFLYSAFMLKHLICNPVRCVLFFSFSAVQWILGGVLNVWAYTGVTTLALNDKRHYASDLCLNLLNEL